MERLVEAPFLLLGLPPQLLLIATGWPESPEEAMHNTPQELLFAGSWCLPPDSVLHAFSSHSLDYCTSMYDGASRSKQLVHPPASRSKQLVHPPAYHGPKTSYKSLKVYRGSSF